MNALHNVSSFVPEVNHFFFTQLTGPIGLSWLYKPTVWLSQSTQRLLWNKNRVALFSYLLLFTINRLYVKFELHLGFTGIYQINVRCLMWLYTWCLFYIGRQRQNKWWHVSKLNKNNKIYRCKTLCDSTETELTVSVKNTTATLMIVRQRVRYQTSVRPGTLVPRATKLRAVTLSLRPTVQPKWAATSPITAVSMPMMRMDTVKAAQPPT